ncbi:histone H1-like [Clupea harengus]|uniref:Histone H1 n=1 Tax=Clupea harengus TaxID=7950 RepID=A0A6P8F0R1_CLUHA|nr:histone H1-like [Clupea harengus]
MAEVAPSLALVPAKAPKKSSTKPKKAGPSVGELIIKAVTSAKEKSGVSLPALKKALSARGYDVERNNSRVKLAVKGLVSKGTLVQTKGTGASGSFKLNKRKAEAKKKPAKKAAPKAKKAAAKKPAAKKAAARKPAAKKPKKRVAAKARKPAAKKAKKPARARKVAKSPRRAKPARRSPTKARRAAPKRR